MNPTAFCRMLLALFLLAPISGGLAAEVREIRVQREGGGPLDESAVLSYLNHRVGAEFDAAALARDVRALEASGRFSFVKAEVEKGEGGWTLIYAVTPRLRIRTLRIDGAEEIGNRRVRELLELGPGDPVDDAVLAFRALKVREHYQKYDFPYMKMEWEIVRDDARGVADVTIEVKEGRAATVRAIVFEGGDALPARARRKAMKQKTWHLFSWITSAGTYLPHEKDPDREAIRRLYLDQGYLDARVGETAVERLGDTKLKLRLPVDQGRQYRLGRIAVSGTKLFTVEEVSASLGVKPGDVASLAAVEQARQSVRDFYGSRGYISSEVQYQLKPQDGDAVVDLEITVREGGRANIRDVRIRGNTTTKDKVIRRELTVYPGEIYNQVKVRNSERRVRNLGFFDFVSAVPEATAEPDLYDVAVEVNEQRVGSFVVGAGFSSVDELIGYAELSHGNFDLLGWPPVGGGQKLKLRATAGTKREDLELSFVEPWFLDRRLSLGLDLFRNNSRYFSDEYQQRNVGGRLTLGQPLGVYNRVNLSYGLQTIRVYDLDEDVSETIKAEEGESLESALTLQVLRDTRDNSFIATRGARTSLSAMYAGGPLGGEVDVYKLEAQTSIYVPLWFDHVFSLRGWAAVVEGHGAEERVPLFNRLFLGGARTLRGFKFRKVGPKDEDGEPVGGLTGWSVTAEYTIPVVEKLRLATFYDIGMIYPEAYSFDVGEADFQTGDYNSDWGFGIRLDFPGFPLRLDYAFPIEADAFNDRSSGRFQFSIGYVF